MVEFLTRAWEALTRRIDNFLFGCALALVGVGLVTLFSASDQSVARVTDPAVLVRIRAGADVGRRQYPAADARPRCRAAVRARGVAAGRRRVVRRRGQRFARWLNIGVARIQPSELMKIALPLMLAWYFQKFEGRINWKDFAVAAVLIVVPVYLIKRQPDLGTALLIAASGCYVLYLAGLSWKVMVGLVVAAGAAGPYVWAHLHDYQRERILTFIDPTRDPLGAGYHSTQASIAIGSGGVIGKGWLNGTQTHLDFLPERHTDFIFACLRRGVRTDRQRVAVGSLLLLIGPRDDDNRERFNAVRALDGGRGHADVLHLRVREHGHGQRPASRRRACRCR
jgi:rod shape determining protein RodA